MNNIKNTKEIFFVEVTDTFGGDANYNWVHRYLVKAATIRGAVSVVSKHEGFAGSLKIEGNYGDMTRHNVSGAAICVFTQYADEYNSKVARALNFEHEGLPVRDDVTECEYHRNPTEYEIKFGEGATHYRNFTVKECCFTSTRIKKQWFIASDDGLRYYN
jgi:hypothetical protein